MPDSALRLDRSALLEAENASYCAIIAGEKAPVMSIRPPVKSNSLASKPGAVSWLCERLGMDANEWSVAVLGAAEADGVDRSGTLGQVVRVSMWSCGGWGWGWGW